MCFLINYFELLTLMEGKICKFLLFFFFCIPDDQSRVCLTPTTSEYESDYINASFIKVLQCFKGIVHLEINFWYVLAYLKGIQDVGVFVSAVVSILIFLG